MVWNKCNTPINELPALVENSLCSYLVRVSVAGDISDNESDNISYSTLYYLNKAFKNHKAYCYTHCAINEHNKMLAKESKMVINFSCDNIDEIDTTVPCVLVAESMKSNKCRKHNITFVKCPNSIDKKIQCKDCKMCMNKHRKSVIVFPAHGVFKNKLHNNVNL